MIEGLITLLSGTAIFFVFQRHPSKPARWLTLEEQRFLVLRNRYQYGHSRTGSKDDFSLAGFVSAAKVSVLRTRCWFLTQSVLAHLDRRFRIFLRCHGHLRAFVVPTHYHCEYGLLRRESSSSQRTSLRLCCSLCCDGGVCIR